jgi:predicted acetyltransferase
MLHAAALIFDLSLMLILEFPNERHRAAYEDMIRRWRNIEPPTSPGKLFAGRNFDEFLSIVQREPTEADPEKVPAHLFFLADTESSKLLGAIQIRHHINHPILIETGGHIGYGICPSERRKGYATEMLALAIPEAKKIGLSRLLVTCKDENAASWKVIESNGGVFERTTFDEGHLARRYWIAVV